MSNNIRFQVHTVSDIDNNDVPDNNGNDNNDNHDNNGNESNESNLLNSIAPVIEFRYRPENNSGYLPLFILLSMAVSLNPVLADPNNRSIVLERVFREEDESLTRDPNKKLQITTQPFNTTSMKFDECSICTECFELEDTVSVLDCSHIFHSNCILEWGHYSASCPVCKNNIAVCERETAQENGTNSYYQLLTYDLINDLD